MMHRKIVNTVMSFLCLFTVNYISAQAPYTGGIGNGITGLTVNLNLLITDSVYNGGTGNGFDRGVRQNMDFSLVDSTYNGGSGHGFNQFTGTAFSLLIIDSIYNGGDGNGFDVFITTGNNLLIIDSLYNGSNGDGFNNATISLIDMSLPCDGTVSYWNGSVSTTWGNASNWDCGVLPDASSTVIIPKALSRYPVLSASRQIKKLIMENGATLLLNSGAILTIDPF